MEAAKPIPTMGVLRMQWLRIAAGCVAGAFTVILQAAFFSHLPVTFAPSLVAITVVTLYLKYEAGIASLVTSTILVNYALLRPRWAWSPSTDALTATAVYVGIAGILLVAIRPLHRRLSRVERTLDEAIRATASETKLRAEAERQFQQRLYEMEQRCERVLDLAHSAASMGRYADLVVQRLSIVSAAIAEAPVGASTTEDENGIPVIPAVRRAVIDLTADWADPESPIARAKQLVAKTDGSEFPDHQHPLVQAARGSVIFGQRIGWCDGASHQVQEASLYAASIADGRLLAMAISTAPSAPITDSEHRSLLRRRS